MAYILVEEGEEAFSKRTAPRLCISTNLTATVVCLNNNNNNNIIIIITKLIIIMVL